MGVCCKCCKLSGRGLCDELITRPEESYRLWYVVECDLETSWMRRPCPTRGGGLLRPPKMWSYRESRTPRTTVFMKFILCFSLQNTNINLAAYFRNTLYILSLLYSHIFFMIIFQGHLLIRIDYISLMLFNELLEMGCITSSILHLQFTKTNTTRCSNVWKLYYSIFIWCSTCFGRHTAHHQEPDTALVASGFSYLEVRWTRRQ
jgi:hypothetical protein